MVRPRIYQTDAEYIQENICRATERQRANSLRHREIGPLPAVENPERKEACRYNLRLFLETYFSNLFTHAWSPAHLALIANLQDAILHGQSSAVALPRGFGKSTLCLCSVMWATFFDHKHYCLLIAANASAAKKLTRSIKYELLYNTSLAQVVTCDSKQEEYVVQGDFPEIVFPLRRVGTQTARASGQLCNGRQTHGQMASDRLVLPDVDGSEGRGNVIESAGLTSGIRGKNITTCKGSLRPDLLLIDDCQTDQSARSAQRVADQLTLLNGCLKGLSGVSNPITSLVTMTVIEPDDLAVQLLKSPQWRSLKFGVVDRLPSDTAMECWNEYNRRSNALIEDGLTDDKISEQMNAYFLEHEAELIDGCRITWEAFKDPLDINPMQKVMRLYYSDPATFSREYMNDPLVSITADAQLSVEDCNKKINEYKRGTIPLETECITCGCDSQTLGLFYTIIAHTSDGSAFIVDFGKCPRGKKTITALYDNIPLEQAVYAGYKDLFTDLLNRVYTRPDGLEMKIGKILVDCSHGPTSPSVNRCIRDMNTPVISPLYGRAKDPNELIFGKKKPGELRGKGWSMPPVRSIKGDDGKKLILPRHVILDTNAWKSTLRAGLKARQGVHGSITVFKEAPQNLKEFFLHLTSERSQVLTGKYGSFDVFKLIPNRANHWLDTTVYSLAGGTMIQHNSSTTVASPRVEQQFTRKRIKLSDIQNKYA